MNDQRTSAVNITRRTDIGNPNQFNDASIGLPVRHVLKSDDSHTTAPRMLPMAPSRIIPKTFTNLGMVADATGNRARDELFFFDPRQLHCGGKAEISG
jgi:hypothetical protein